VTTDSSSGDQPTPSWAEQGLSLDLTRLRSLGEGQDLEYMRMYPKDTGELAKEVAAFATSNAGTILLGVEDTGELTGLQGVDTSKDRDKLVERVAGVCGGTVAPSITPVVKWVVEGGKTVLVINVPKGSEPVYYSNGKPYLRHITSSRPADPHEVKELVRAFLATQNAYREARGTEAGDFYSELGSALGEVELWAEVPRRSKYVNPKLEQWRASYADVAPRLRDLSARRIAIELGLRDGLRELADRVEEVATFRLTVGCGQELDRLSEAAVSLARQVRSQSVGTIPLTADSLEEAKELIRHTARRVADTTKRTQSPSRAGQVAEVMSVAGASGDRLLELSFNDLRALHPTLSARLRELGASFKAIEGEHMELDGGASERRILESFRVANQRLLALAANL
jgi:ATP-dependent DNA helicase RecG